MNNSKDNAIAEYSIIQQAINANLQFTVQMFGFSIAAIVAIVVASSQVENIFILLAIHVVILLSSVYVSRQTELLINTETFIIVFVESDSENFKWKQRLFQTYKQRKARSPKALFLTFISNFSDFVAFSYFFILLSLSVCLVYIGYVHDNLRTPSIVIITASVFLFCYVLETLTKYSTNTYYSKCIDFWRNFKEQEELGNLEQLLDFKPLQAKLVESNGKEAFIPESAYQALRQVIQLVASGQEVSVIPQKREMTSRQADDVLNISSHLTITKYIEAAMARAIYDVLEDDGTFYGRIPECQGVLANAETREACRDELQEVLEEWILLGLQLGHSLPVLDGIDLSFKKEAA